jgi:hypothetical protein
MQLRGFAQAQVTTGCLLAIVACRDNQTDQTDQTNQTDQTDDPSDPSDPSAKMVVSPSCAARQASQSVSGDS